MPGYCCNATGKKPAVQHRSLDLLQLRAFKAYVKFTNKLTAPFGYEGSQEMAAKTASIREVSTDDGRCVARFRNVAECRRNGATSTGKRGLPSSEEDEL